MSIRNFWVLINVYWIRLKLVRSRFVKYRSVRYIRFGRYRYPLYTFYLFPKRLGDMSCEMSSRRLQDVLEDKKLLR